MAAVQHDITVEQGATYEDPGFTRHEPDPQDPTQPGAPRDLTGWTARMQIRVDQQQPVLLEATTDNGYIQRRGCRRNGRHQAARRCDRPPARPARQVRPGARVAAGRRLPRGRRKPHDAPQHHPDARPAGPQLGEQHVRHRLQHRQGQGRLVRRAPRRQRRDRGQYGWPAVLTFVDDGRGTVDDVEQAEAVSSQGRGPYASNQHYVLIDLDYPAVVLPSSTQGHSHLYIDKGMPWDLEKLLVVMVEVGLVEPGYLAASRKRKATFLRLPWIRKGHEFEDRHDAGGWSPEEVEEFLEAPTLPDDPMLNRSGWTAADVPF